MSAIKQIREIFGSVAGLWLSFLLAGSGLLTNSITIAVFYKQGYAESASITLTAISMVDLLKCLIGFIYRIYGILHFIDASLSLNWLNIGYIPNGHSQTVTGSLVYVFTMYVSLERCLCVCVPFKVKLLLTKQVTCCVLFLLTCVVLATYFYTTIAFRVVWLYNTEINQTLVTYVSSDILINTAPLLHYLYYINVFWYSFTFMVILSSTLVLIAGLYLATRFRSRHSQTGPNTRTSDQLSQTTTSKGLSGRECQVVKTLLVIIVLCLVSITPRLVHPIIRYIEPQFYIGGRYEDEYIIVSDLILVIDFLNSSTNFYILMTMSSHFRFTLTQLPTVLRIQTRFREQQWKC